MKPNQQSRTKDQVETVTSKSSGLSYIPSTLNPSQNEADARQKVTKNDKGNKRG